MSQLGDADFHFIPVGNAGDYTAYTRGYREEAERGVSTRVPRMFGFQAEGSAPLVRGEVVAKKPRRNRLGHPHRQPRLVGARARGPRRHRRLVRRHRRRAHPHRAEALADTVGVFVEPASAISVAGLLDRAEAGVVPAGATVVLTVTGHGLKDPQWALRNADGTEVQPVVVDASTSEVASLLDLGMTVTSGDSNAGAAPVRSVAVRVPATSANLGPGFDTLGLALSVYDED